MSAIDKLLEKRQVAPSKTSTNKGTKTQSTSAIDRLLSVSPQDRQRKKDEQSRTAAWDSVTKNLEQKPSGTKGIINGIKDMFRWSNIKNTAKNIAQDVKSDPTGAATAIPKGLFDAGSVVLNNTANFGNKVLDKITRPVVDKVTGTKGSTPPTLKLPVFSEQLKEFTRLDSAKRYGNVGNLDETDTARALRESATNVAGFELGNRLVKPFGLGKFGTGVAGNVLGGQLMTDTLDPRERLKQAALDATLGAFTEGIGAGFGRLKKPTNIDEFIQTRTPEAKPLDTATPVPDPVTRTTPITESPFRTSSVAQSIEANAIESKLLTQFDDLAQFEPRTVQDQARRVADLITNDVDLARRIVSGAEPVPSGMSSSMFIKGIEEYAIKNSDVNLLRDLGRSKLVSDTSLHAQELRFLAERNPYSAVAKISEIKKIREDALLRKHGQNITTKEVKTIKSEIAKTAPKPKDWDSFIDSLKCN